MTAGSGAFRPGARLKLAWQNLLASLWFVPAGVILAGVLLAVAMIALDERIGHTALERMPRLFGASAEGARSLLAGVATSMVTVAGVAFSITIVVLGLAATQYSSRVLRTFMANRVNQVVLGVLMAVFAYCLVVLRTIRGGEEAFIPSIALITGIALAFVGIGFFVYYIHHTAASIQASRILSLLARDTLEAIDASFGERLAGDAPAPRIPRTLRWSSVPVGCTGYIETIDYEMLERCAIDHDLVVRIEHGVGEFVIDGMALVAVAGNITTEAAKELTNAFVMGPQRTVEQDPAFGIRQIVDVALRALSPGINDTTTAQICLDHLSAIMARLAGRQVEQPPRFHDGRLRLVPRGATFQSLLALAFDQIRRHGRDNLALLEHQLLALGRLKAYARTRSQREALMAQVLALRDAANATYAGEAESCGLTRRGEALLAELRSEPPSDPAPDRSCNEETLHV